MRGAFVFLVGLAACAGKSPVVGSTDANGLPAKDAIPFRIAVLGDRTGEPDDALWQDTVNQVVRMRPDLVLTVGDLADDADDEEDWSRAMAPFGAFADLGIEVQYTPGNHDIHDGESAARFLRLTGQQPYRSFDRGGVHWIVLDNSIANDASSLPEKQLAWLDADLEAHPGPKVVLMHKPFWALAAGAGASDPLHERFVAHGVRAVLTGHWHRHAHQRIDGIEYVIVGSSGGGRAGVPSAVLGTTAEFLWITATDELSLATVGQSGVRGVELPSLADESMLDRLQRRGGLRAELNAEGTQLRLAGRAGDSAVTWAGEVSSAPELPPLSLKLDAGDDGEGDFVSLPAPVELPLPRVSVVVDLPDTGPTPVEVVPDWPRAAEAHGMAPTVDADLSEWIDTAPTVSAADWTTTLGEASTADPTTLWMGYDAEALYIAARCEDPDPDRINVLHTGRDGQSVYNDRIGVLLSPDPDALYWVYLTASGAVWDVAFTDTGADFTWDETVSEARIGPEGWTVEARIPWAALDLSGPPEGGLGFDARRKQEYRQSEAVFTPAFSATDPARLGVLRFAPTPGQRAPRP